jgi:hypothetical protein
LESKCGFGGSKSNFLNGGFAGSVGVASFSSLPCFTGSIFSDWLNSIDSFLSIVLNVMEEASEAELLESFVFQESFSSFDTVFLNSGFACGVGVALFGTRPGITRECLGIVF